VVAVRALDWERVVVRIHSLSPSAIKITPEMAEAGEEALLEAYGGLDLNPCPSEVAIRVYRAMVSASATPYPYPD
jgi:hypothetical protein